MARLMKDGLGEPAIARMVSSLSKAYPELNSSVLSRDILSGLSPLELKDRVRHIIRCLHKHMPGFVESAKILQRVSNFWDPGDPEDSLRAFAAWPLVDYVGEYGVGHFDLGLETLRRITGLFSAEFALRPFLAHDLDRTLSTLVVWSKDRDESVRRLVSEGTRPLLPWGTRQKTLQNNPDKCLSLLEALRDDVSEGVRRSVANHLNDHSKSHPEWVLDVCEDWYETENKNRCQLIRHATRTLVKSGSRRIYPLLGYTARPRVTALDLKIATPIVELGESLEFSVTLQSTARRSQSFVLDFAVHHLKKNGERLPKVFKWSVPTLGAGDSMHFYKNHSIKSMTTRKYYSGLQGVTILVNGEVKAEFEFELKVAE